LQDDNGDSVQIELKGYHIPYAEVRLFSPQVLLKTIGGHALQTVDKVINALENGISLCAQFCLQSNLPMIPLGLENNSKSCFWNNAFGFSVYSFCDINTIKAILHQANTNLLASQKELLMWHQPISHASVKRVQKLMRNRKWLPGMADNKMSLHSGPFITTRKGSCAQLWDTSTLKCVACLYAKASTRSPDNLAPRQSSKKQVLKQDHLKPGDCISANHYSSPIIG
jgi:hypothetical protein